MAAIVKALQDIEKSEKEKIISLLKEAGKEHSGKVLLVRNYGETFILRENYVSSEITIKAPFPFEPFKRYSMGADSVTYEQFAKNLTIDEMKKVAEKLAKLGF
jgi:hypothetical protein